MRFTFDFGMLYKRSKIRNANNIIAQGIGLFKEAMSYHDDLD